MAHVRHPGDLAMILLVTVMIVECKLKLPLCACMCYNQLRTTCALLRCYGSVHGKSSRSRTNIPHEAIPGCPKSLLDFQPFCVKNRQLAFVSQVNTKHLPSAHTQHTHCTTNRHTVRYAEKDSVIHSNVDLYSIAVLESTLMIYLIRLEIFSV